MPAGSPRRGGFYHSKEDFPSLPIPTYTSAVVNPPPTKITYAKSTRTSPFVPISNLPLLPDIAIKRPIVTEKDGVKAVIFQQEEMEASMEVFKYALVARFYGERPSVDKFDMFVNSEWDLKKPAVVGLLNPRHIMIRLESEEDFTRAWVREDTSFNNHRFTLFKWSEGILDNKVMKRAIWVELLRLPVMYQLPSMLEQIGNNIGRFLCLDERTRAGKHPISPRLCVELDLAAPIPKDVWVGYVTPAGMHIGFKQNITYVFKKTKCTSCKSFGHELPQCPFRTAHNDFNKLHACTDGVTQQQWVVKKHHSEKSVDSRGKGKDSTQYVHKMFPRSQESILGKGISTTPCHIHSTTTCVTQKQLENVENTKTELQLDGLSLAPNSSLDAAKLIKLGPHNIDTRDHLDFSSKLSKSILNNPVSDPNISGPIVEFSNRNPHTPIIESLKGPDLNKESTNLVSTSLEYNQSFHDTSGMNCHDSLAISANPFQICQDMSPSGHKKDKPNLQNEFLDSTIQCHFVPTHFTSPHTTGQELVPFEPVLPLAIVLTPAFQFDKHSAPPKSQNEPHSSTSPDKAKDKMDIIQSVGEVPPYFYEHNRQYVVESHSAEARTEDIANKIVMHEQDLDLNRNELAIIPYTIKMLQDSSQEQAEIFEAPTSKPINSKKHKEKIQPSFLDSVRKATQRHIKVSSKAIRAEKNSRIDPGIK